MLKDTVMGDFLCDRQFSAVSNCLHYRPKTLVHRPKSRLSLLPIDFLVSKY